jgi:hypothetical protein
MKLYHILCYYCIRKQHLERAHHLQTSETIVKDCWDIVHSPSPMLNDSHE